MVVNIVSETITFKSRKRKEGKRGKFKVSYNRFQPILLKPFVSSLRHANSTSLSLVPIPRQSYCMGRAWPGNAYKPLYQDEISFVVALETRRSVRDAFNAIHSVTPAATFTEAYNKVSRYYRYPSNSS